MEVWKELDQDEQPFLSDYKELVSAYVHNLIFRFPDKNLCNMFLIHLSKFKLMGIQELYLRRSL
jgi:hypothetical protein